LTRGNAQISVAFVAPASNGSAITGYTASCSSSDGGTAGSNTGGSSPIVVFALTNGKTYTCAVLATNAVGDGQLSSTSGSAVPATVPSAPAVPTLTRANAQISVAFVAPSSGGSAITGYTVSCASSDGGAAGSNSGGGSPIVVASLTNGKTYTCTVLATNAVGDGNASNASASAVPATVPNAPAVPTLTHGNAQISVAFVAPASGGSGITGYTASCTSSDGGAAGSNTGGGSPIVVASLWNGKTYTCTVLATNAVGDGNVSNASASAVPARTPSAPAAPTLARGNQRLTVSFLTPAAGGSAITGYSASCTSSDGGVAGTQTGAASPIQVTSLTNGKLYTCTVRAINAEGSGAQSASSTAVRPGMLPWNIVAPTITGATINHHTLTSNDGTWGGAPTPAVTRQWQRCNLQKLACVNIFGENGHMYVLHTADVNHTIRVRMTAKNVLGSSSRTSRATARVTN
jgi:hypothetical protein